jgi:hypothetical protein
MQIPGMIRSHPRTTLIVALLGVGLLLFGVLWFEPQKLITEDRIDEALPGASTEGLPGEGSSEMVSGAAGSPATPDVVARGRFMSLEHESSGTAEVLETAEGKRFLRFEDFRTSNGPDLVVYLSAKAASEDWYGYDQDFVDLGELKGNVGNQNYAIPEGVDLGRYRSAVVWCRRFEVGFAVAPLR